jgi:hypothetical protein
LLRRIYGLLLRDGAAFDQGDYDQALHLAVLLRALLHTASSKGLLAQLRLAKGTDFTDTATGPSTDPAFELTPGPSGLAVIRATAGPSGSAAFVAPLGTSPAGTLQRRSFNSWWSGARPIPSAQDWGQLSRKDLVLGMANTDIAHVQEHVDEDYAWLSGSAGWTVSTDGRPLDIAGDLAQANVRQIAWEVQDTLEREAAKILHPTREDPVER